MLALGRPPAKERVVATRRVAAPDACAAVRVNLIVKGVLVDLKRAIGTSVKLLLPAVYVSGPQDDMRLSLGCILRNLSAFLNPSGWPSYSPTLKSDVRDAREPEIFAVVALPALTLTDEEASLNSFW